jgi:YebC/PmpR family DNA-binding regulatory protein
MEEALYEGFGPSGVAVLVKVITDNKNRTLPEIKKIFSSHGGSIGGSGSVQWMFEQLGIITVSKEKITNKDEFELQLIETGAQDIVEYELGIEIKTRVENFQKILQKIKELNIEPIRSGIEWVAKEPVNVSEEVQKSLGSLFEALEEHEDVEDFFTNAH